MNSRLVKLGLEGMRIEVKDRGFMLILSEIVAVDERGYPKREETELACRDLDDLLEVIGLECRAHAARLKRLAPGKEVLHSPARPTKNAAPDQAASVPE